MIVISVINFVFKKIHSIKVSNVTPLRLWIWWYQHGQWSTRITDFIYFRQLLWNHSALRRSRWRLKRLRLKLNKTYVNLHLHFQCTHLLPLLAFKTFLKENKISFECTCKLMPPSNLTNTNFFTDLYLAKI